MHGLKLNFVRYLSHSLTQWYPGYRLERECTNLSFGICLFVQVVRARHAKIRKGKPKITSNKWLFTIDSMEVVVNKNSTQATFLQAVLLSCTRIVATFFFCSLDAVTIGTASKFQVGKWSDFGVYFSCLSAVEFVMSMIGKPHFHIFPNQQLSGRLFRPEAAGKTYKENSTRLDEYIFTIFTIYISNGLEHTINRACDRFMTLSLPMKNKIQPLGYFKYHKQKWKIKIYNV